MLFVLKHELKYIFLINGYIDGFDWLDRCFGITCVQTVTDKFQRISPLINELQKLLLKLLRFIFPRRLVVHSDDRNVINTLVVTY